MSSSETAAPAAPTIALVSARAARALDEDLPPLYTAMREAGVRTEIVDWDAPGTDWARFDAALLRSTWDYMERLSEFLSWCDNTGEATRLINPAAVVRWNTDKHYLTGLLAAGVPTIPSKFIEPGADGAAALADFLAQDPASEFVVKPAIGAGSRDAQRYGRPELARATAQVERLLAQRRSVLLQPHLGSVDRVGETALIYFAGRFSHAVRKASLLKPGAQATAGLFAPEQISSREPGRDELAVGERALAAVPGGVPLYGRVDLLRDARGVPHVLEVELTEPSLFFPYAPGSAERFARAVIGHVRAGMARSLA